MRTQQTKMATINIKKGLLILPIAIILFCGCKKNNTGSVSEKKLEYAGSSEALSEGAFDLKTIHSGNYTCFYNGLIAELVNGRFYANKVSQNADVFNHVKSSWNRYSPYPARNVPAVAILGDKMFMAGGIINPATGSVSDDVTIFNLTGGSVTYAKLSRARYGIAVAAANGKVLFAGGASNAGYYDVVDIYDANTNEWSVNTLSQPRATMAAAAVGGKLLFAGGSSNGIYSKVVDIYDTQTGKWSTSTLSKAQVNSSVTVAGNKIFISGGVVEGAMYSETVEVYDAGTNAWSVINLPGNKIRATTCANERYVFITTGSEAYGFANRLHIFDTQNGQLKVVNFPFPITEFAMGVIGNKVVIAGGRKTDNSSLDEGTTEVLVYDVATNQMDTTAFSLPEKIRMASAIGGDNKLFIGGGVTTSPAPLLKNQRMVSVFQLR